MTRSAERYAAVEKLMADHGFSERRACRLVGVNRSAWQYEPLRGRSSPRFRRCAASLERLRREDDAVHERMREIVNERRRFGYVGWRSCSGVRGKA